jgi:hypothetical protein
VPVMLADIDATNMFMAAQGGGRRLHDRERKSVVGGPAHV